MNLPILHSIRQVAVCREEETSSGQEFSQLRAGMLKFNPFNDDAVAVIIVRSRNLAIVIGSKSIPLRSIQRVELHSMNTIDSFIRPNSCNPMSSGHDAKKYICCLSNSTLHRFYPLQRQSVPDIRTPQRS